MWADDWDRLTETQQEAALDLLGVDLDWDDRPAGAADTQCCGCYACTGSGVPANVRYLSNDEWADAGKPQRLRPIINVELPEPGELT